MPDPKISGDDTSLDPKQAVKIEKSIAGKEQAPSTAEQSGLVSDWKTAIAELGTDFDPERIPLRKRLRMMRDPVIAFGLHYRKIPLIGLEFHVEARDKNGPNAQVAAFLDQAWRRIHARYILQVTLKWAIAYQAIVKRFEQHNPGGVYFDPFEENVENKMKPVWSEGNIEPWIWKAFTTLHPQRVEPMFDDKNGEFNGIKYEIPPAQRQRGLGFTSKSSKANQNFREIDVWHSLWSTNMRDSVFGSIFGYPLTGHVYQYWWSYWWRWIMSDRLFERLAIPPLIAWHPPGEWSDPEDPTAPPISNQERALAAAAGLRAGSIAAVPGQLASASMTEDKSSSQREWDFKYLETENDNFNWFHESLNYLDVMKLRGLFIPEQSLTEGKGGSSSRNVMEGAQEFLEKSLDVEWGEIKDEINRFIFPQILVVNFPEFLNNGGSAEIIGHGFRPEDMEILKQIIQVVGQNDPDKLGIDLRESLRRVNVPLMTPEQQWRNEQEKAAQAAAASPPPVNNRNARTAPISDFAPAGNPGGTNGGSVPQNGNGSALGFDDIDDERMIYVQPSSSIYMSGDLDFATNLPSTKHYNDNAIKALAVQMRKIWVKHLSKMYPDFAKFVANKKLELADDSAAGEVATGTAISAVAADKAADDLINDWEVGSSVIINLANSTGNIIQRILNRQMKQEVKNLGGDIKIDNDKLNDFISDNVAKLVKGTHETTANELRNFVSGEIQKGVVGEDLSKSIIEHFSDFPNFRANTIARDATRDSVNAATLITSEAANLRYVRAKDGSDDPECKKRNNKLYTVREAWKVMAKEHPNGTIEFDPMPRANFTVEYVDELPELSFEDALTYYDEDTETAYISNQADQGLAEAWLYELTEILSSERSVA